MTVVKRESLAVDRLWEMSHQGRLAKVSRQQFDAYYSNQKSGIGVSVGAAELWRSPLALSQLRQKLGQRWQPPQQLQQLNNDQISVFASNLTS